MPDIEDEMKLQNWLSVLTYDTARYAKAGGQVVIEWTADGLIVRFPSVMQDTPGIHGRFLDMTVAPPYPQEAPTP